MRAADKGAPVDVEGMPGWGNIDGLSWSEHPLPSRWHRCSPYSWGWIFGSKVERCACGARRNDGRGHWYGRNSRRSK